PAPPRLARPLVVGEAAARAEVAQEVEPAEAQPLIGAQSAAEPGRRVGGSDAVEAAQALPSLGERLVAARGGLVGQPGVQEERLRHLEPQVVSLALPEPGKGGPTLEPGLGEQAQAAVAQRDEPLAAAESGEKPRQRDAL